jgi:NADP-reducing hydrogenase subunit HndA
MCYDYNKLFDIFCQARSKDQGGCNHNVLREQELFAKLKQVIDELRNEKGALMPIMQKRRIFSVTCRRMSSVLLRKNLIYPCRMSMALPPFYSQFNLEPKGRYSIGLCLGTAC